MVIFLNRRAKTGNRIFKAFDNFIEVIVGGAEMHVPAHRNGYLHWDAADFDPIVKFEFRVRNYYFVTLSSPFLLSNPIVIVDYFYKLI